MAYVINDGKKFYDKETRKQILKQYIRIERKFIKSKQWRSLKPQEKEIYIYLQMAGLGKGKRHIKHVGEIVRGECFPSIETIMVGTSIKSIALSKIRPLMLS